jgi:hypothetical protein
MVPTTCGQMSTTASGSMPASTAPRRVTSLNLKTTATELSSIRVFV